jgi:hypothetical protein
MNLKFISLLLFFILFVPQKASAITMTNDNWILKGGNFNDFSGSASDSTHKLSFTGGEFAVGLYSGTNYKVRAGFQYLRPTDTFRFTISNLLINFGELNPGEPISRTNTVTVTNQSAPGYQVTALENHPMRSTTTDIPDTTCDDGVCTETTASAWSSLLTYGFGFRCDNLVGADCESDFSSATSYRQFANNEGGEAATVFMSGGSNASSSAQITYKVNISQAQPPGTYQNSITYIASPTF